MAKDRTEKEEVALEVIAPRALELIERAQIDMQIETARKYPRDLKRSRNRMMDFATIDEETAESCFYTLSRSGKNIQGPSVRLAEIAVSCYGNIRAASRIIDNDGKTITSQGICHDLENNVMISVEVRRRITNKEGKTYNEDMQVTTGNAANSIAFRNACFKVIPGALVKPVYDAAKAVAIGTATTLAVKREKMVKRLNAMGVTTPQILAKLGRTSVENMGLDDLETLIGLGTAIKDGDSTIEEAFFVADKTPPLRGNIAMDALTASAEPNRGHDATAAPKPESDAPELPLSSEPTTESSDEPPANLQHLEAWPDGNPAPEWAWVGQGVFRLDDEGNYKKHSERAWPVATAEAAVHTTKSPVSFRRNK